MQVTLSLLKIIIMIVIFAIVIITGNVPFRYKQFKEKSSYISYATAFTGGVFMSIALIHLAYAANLRFQHYFQQSQSLSNQTEHYPFTQLLMVIGFSLILFLEKLIGEHTDHSSIGQYSCQNEQQNALQESYHNKKSQSPSIQKKTDNLNNSISQKTHLEMQVNSNSNHRLTSIQSKKLLITKQLRFLESKNPLNAPKLQQDNKKTQENIQTQSKGQNHSNSTILSESIFKFVAQKNNQQNIHQKNLQNSLTEQINFNNQQQNPINQNPQLQSNEVIIQIQQKINQNAENLSLSNTKMNASSYERRANLLVSRQQQIMIKSQIHNTLSIGAYVLQITFGIHSLLEGIAIGITNSFRNTLILGSAVFAHKWAEGLLHGIALKNGNVNARQASIMIFISATMNPIGMIIGWVFSGSGDLFIGILLSISAGTFLYVATLEVLAEEFNQTENKFWKLVFYLFGIGFISSLWFLEEH